jgi:hypothetical protein
MLAKNPAAAVDAYDGGDDEPPSVSSAVLLFATATYMDKDMYVRRSCTVRNCQSCMVDWSGDRLLWLLCSISARPWFVDCSSFLAPFFLHHREGLSCEPMQGRLRAG